MPWDFISCATFRGCSASNCCCSTPPTPAPTARSARGRCSTAPGMTTRMAGDAGAPPYPSVVAAMRDGWRVIQVPAAAAGRAARRTRHRVSSSTSSCSKSWSTSGAEGVASQVVLGWRGGGGGLGSLLASRWRLRRRRFPALRRRRAAPPECRGRAGGAGGRRPTLAVRRPRPAATPRPGPVSRCPPLFGAVARRHRDAAPCRRSHGIIESLLGPDPIYYYHYTHVIGAAQRLEPAVARRRGPGPAAAVIRHPTVLLPDDTPRQMGGTMILPGSHLRRIDERPSPATRTSSASRRWPVRRDRRWSATTASGTAASPT